MSRFLDSLGADGFIHRPCIAIHEDREYTFSGSAVEGSMLGRFGSPRHVLHYEGVQYNLCDPGSADAVAVKMLLQSDKDLREQIKIAEETAERREKLHEKQLREIALTHDDQRRDLQRRIDRLENQQSIDAMRIRMGAVPVDAGSGSDVADYLERSRNLTRRLLEASAPIFIPDPLRVQPKNSGFPNLRKERQNVLTGETSHVTSHFDKTQKEESAPAIGDGKCPLEID